MIFKKLLDRIRKGVKKDMGREKLYTKEELKDRTNARRRQLRKDNPEKAHKLDKKYDDKRRRKIKQREYQKQWRENNKIKERRENEMPRGVFERKEEYKKMMSDNFKGRKIINGHWAERSNNEMDNGKENFLHIATEFLEKMKEKEDIDIDMINKWQGEITTLGEAIAKDFEKAIEAKRKPIRKVWYMAIRAKKEDTEKYEKILDDIVIKSKIQFPEALLITKSLCGEK